MYRWYEFFILNFKEGKKKNLMYSKLVIIVDVKIQGRKQLNRVVSLINIISPI